MAYFQKNNNEDEKQNQNNTGNVGGNVYSTSSSEVSTVDSGTKGDTDRKSDTGSGSFVNLNKYLDSNQGKVGKYTDSLVDPYTSKESGYKSSLNDSKLQYTEATKQNNLDSNEQENYLKKFYNPYEKRTPEENQKAANTLVGYIGADKYENTGDQYGYTTNKKQSDEYQNVGSNLGNKAFQKTLMSNNLSTGGKNLDSFLINANTDSKNKISDYGTKFTELGSLLDNQTNDLNQLRQKAVDDSTAKKQHFESLLPIYESEALDQQKTLKERNQNNAKKWSQYVDTSTKSPTPIQGLYFDTGLPLEIWNDTSRQAEENYIKNTQNIRQATENLRNGNLDSQLTYAGGYSYGDIIDNPAREAYNKAFNDSYNYAINDLNNNQEYSSRLNQMLYELNNPHGLDDNSKIRSQKAKKYLQTLLDQYAPELGKTGTVFGQPAGANTMSLILRWVLNEYYK